MFYYYVLGGDTTAPSGLYARLCHAFLVLLSGPYHSHDIIDYTPGAKSAIYHVLL